VVHVLDASRAVDVVSSLLSDTQRPAFDLANRARQETLRVQHGALKRREILPFEAARGNRFRPVFSEDTRAVPVFTGARVVDDVQIEDLVPFIDWTMFFAAWELKARFPAILEHPKYGEAARDLYKEGRALLDRIIADRSIQLGGVYGFWPANAVGEDVVLYQPDGTGADAELVRFNMLRQQERLSEGKPNRSLVDYVAPKESGLTDYIGAFAVTAGLGVDGLVAHFERDLDDYRAIIVKAIADRLAEAFAEYLHKRVRNEWGYGAREQLSADQLIDEQYRGIRPAFGYPACPDHSEKTKLFALLDASAAGIQLTENFAMTPAASVSGLYFAHPDASYFDVGRLGQDQVQDYARRKGLPLEQAERWLTPNLGYEPANRRSLRHRTAGRRDRGYIIRRLEYSIKQYPLESGALEIQYIEEFFGEFPRKKTAREIVTRLRDREFLILITEAPLPDDPGMIAPVSFKVVHELRPTESGSEAAGPADPDPGLRPLRGPQGALQLDWRHATRLARSRSFPRAHRGVGSVGAGKRLPRGRGEEPKTASMTCVARSISSSSTSSSTKPA
jgi:hypothetical protein